MVETLGYVMGLRDDASEGADCSVACVGPAGADDDEPLADVRRAGVRGADDDDEASIASRDSKHRA